MALNPILPYIIRIEYAAGSLFHKLDVGVDTVEAVVPGTPSDEILLQAKSASAEVSVDQAANDIWGALRAQLSTTVLASTYTFWQTDENNGVLSLLSAGSLDTPNGAAVGAYIPAQQATWTFRCGGGSIKKVVLQEVNIPGNSRVPIDPADPLAVYALSGDSVLLSRGRGFPIQALNLSVGQNEEIWRARYR